MVGIMQSFAIGHRRSIGYNEKRNTLASLVPDSCHLLGRSIRTPFIIITAKPIASALHSNTRFKQTFQPVTLFTAIPEIPPFSTS
jgi:hypothetical protein